MEVSVQLHASAALLQGNNPRYPLDNRLGESQGRSGRDEELNTCRCLEVNPTIVLPTVHIWGYRDVFPFLN
jgi:hypothetical protein